MYYYITERVSLEVFACKEYADTLLYDCDLCFSFDHYGKIIVFKRKTDLEINFFYTLENSTVCFGDLQRGVYFLINITGEGNCYPGIGLRLTNGEAISFSTKLRSKYSRGSLFLVNTTPSLVIKRK
jgi:hypothetical protein